LFLENEATKKLHHNKIIHLFLAEHPMFYPLDQVSSGNEAKIPFPIVSSILESTSLTLSRCRLSE